MNMITLDAIGYKELRDLAIHGMLDGPVKARCSFEVAKILDDLLSDQQRVDAIDTTLQLRPWTHPEWPDHNDGIDLELNALQVYIPTAWHAYMMDPSIAWNQGWGGILSTDDGNMNRSCGTGLQRFLWETTIFRLKADQNITFFTFYADWRQQVMEYTRTRINFWADQAREAMPRLFDSELKKE